MEGKGFRRLRGVDGIRRILGHAPEAADDGEDEATEDDERQQNAEQDFGDGLHQFTPPVQRSNE